MLKAAELIEVIADNEDEVFCYDEENVKTLGYYNAHPKEFLTSFRESQYDKSLDSFEQFAGKLALLHPLCNNIFRYFFECHKDNRERKSSLVKIKAYIPISECSTRGLLEGYEREKAKKKDEKEKLESECKKLREEVDALRKKGNNLPTEHKQKIEELESLISSIEENKKYDENAIMAAQKDNEGEYDKIAQFNKYNYHKLKELILNKSGVDGSPKELKQLENIFDKYLEANHE